MSDKPEPSVTAGHPDYRRHLSDNLLVRWSTPADRAGCAMVTSMAFIGTPEEDVEADWAIRGAEKMTMNEYYSGDPSLWAVCVSLSGPQAFPRKNPASQDSPYVSKVRQEAEEAREPVVAVIHYKIIKWAFERATCEVDVLKPWYVACRPDFRATIGTGNIMKALFEMVHDRGRLLGVAFYNIVGLPAYYRNHGYEYALHFGRHLSTVVGELPESPPLPIIQPSATANDIKPPGDLALLSAPAESSAGSVLRPHYRLRQATPSDAPALLTMYEMGKARSDAWVSLPSNLLEDAITWAVNPREPPFMESADVAPAFWVLERSESTDSTAEIVGAVQLARLLDPKEARPLARVIRLLWDEKTDASIFVSELVTRVVPAANELLRATAENIRKLAPHTKIDQPSQLPRADGNGGNDNVPPLSTNLGQIKWYLAEGHPLRPWLIANRLAEEKSDPPYDLSNDWYIFIPSLSHFITLLKPALNARLSKFEYKLGKSFSCELLIVAYSRSYPGVRISIQDCTISSISPLIADVPRLAIFGKREPNMPNLCAPRGALTQLFMGYSSWQEITRRAPDAIAAPHITPVIDILFPKVTTSSHVYF